MRLENDFVVPAPAEQAWALLNDVPRVIPCMPGAELVELVDDNTFKSMMHVKLGPISLQFDTDVTRVETDPSSRSVKLAVAAREVKGRGGARATIESTLSEQAGETHVSIATDLALQGTVAQYGRGVVGDVASQLTARFAQALAAELADADGSQAAPGDAGPRPQQREPAAVKPVGGLRLGLTALVRSLRRLVRPGR